MIRIGTIDKKYPKTKLGYAFEIMEAAVERIVTRVKVPYNVEIVTACRKDSQDITEGDRYKPILSAAETTALGY